MGFAAMAMRMKGWIVSVAVNFCLNLDMQDGWDIQDGYLILYPVYPYILSILILTKEIGEKKHPLLQPVPVKRHPLGSYADNIAQAQHTIAGVVIDLRADQLNLVASGAGDPPIRATG